MRAKWNHISGQIAWTDVEKTKIIWLHAWANAVYYGMRAHTNTSASSGSSSIVKVNLAAWANAGCSYILQVTPAEHSHNTCKESNIIFFENLHMRPNVGRYVENQTHPRWKCNILHALLYMLCMVLFLFFWNQHVKKGIKKTLLVVRHSFFSMSLCVQRMIMLVSWMGVRATPPD